MKIKKELIKREICGDVFLVPVGKTMYDTNGLFLLTELGAFIWDLLPGAENQEQILRAIVAEYEVEEDTARKDLAQYLDKLKTMEIL